MNMEKKLRVGILGATGMVGQRFITLLANHPWYEITALAASPRSAGKTYEEAVGGRWKMQKAMPEAVKNIVVMNVNEVEKVASEVDFVFSAVDMSKEEIRAIEDAYAKTETPVVSNNSAHRWTPDVPMVVPEINPEHFEVIEAQKKRLGTKKGFVAVKPNCSIQSYAPALFALKEFGPKEVVATTYQAISGAGKTFKDWPEMVENIIPFIGGEEEKSEQEPLRLFGKVVDGKIEKATAPLITTQCIRVPVLDGHTAAVFVNFEKKPTKEEIIEAAKIAGAHEFIIKLPDAYDTRIGFGHKELSGGERQRISIARAVLLNPKILILDEATAAMDTQTERTIQSALENLVAGKTTIMIAHRLSTLRDADRLIVIENGKMPEYGTHAELIRQKGIYYKLYTLQMEALKNIGVTE